MNSCIINMSGINLPGQFNKQLNVPNPPGWIQHDSVESNATLIAGWRSVCIYWTRGHTLMLSKVQKALNDFYGDGAYLAWPNRFNRLERTALQSSSEGVQLTSKTVGPR